MGEVRYTETVEITASPEDVFDFRLDFSRLPEINPNVSNLERIDGGDAPGVGAAYRFDVTLEGMGTIPSTLRVTEAERPERIVNEMESGLTACEVCTFTPSGEGTGVAFEVAITVPDEIDEAARSFIESTGRAQVRLELDLMKKLLEGGKG